MTVQQHWDDRHRSTPVEELSWFQPTPATSLELFDSLGVDSSDAVIDVGGGVSMLAAALVERGFGDVTVLDVSKEALDAAAERLPAPSRVSWVVADVRTWRPPRAWRVWHDRAVFHFLTTTEDRDAYLRTMSQALAAGGALVIGTFAPDGSDHCSGLPTQRYDANTLLETISTQLDVESVTATQEVHVTPNGAAQSFTWIAGRRRA